MHKLCAEMQSKPSKPKSEENKLELEKNKPNAWSVNFDYRFILIIKAN